MCVCVCACVCVRARACAVCVYAAHVLPADVAELAMSVLVRTSMEEAGRPRDAAIAGSRRRTNNYQNTQRDQNETNLRSE